jgi:hypothetical protein
MRWLLLLSLVTSIGLAQTYAGDYEGDTPSGSLRLQFIERGDELTGVLTGPGLRWDLEGVVYPADGVAAGAASSADGMIGFEAYLDGDLLGLYLFELSPEGAPIVESAVELVLRRTDAPPRDAPQVTAPRRADAPPTPGGVAAAANPLAPAAPPVNPLAPADPFIGTFADGAMTLHLVGGAGQYEGRIEFGGQVYPARATRDGAALRGAFTSAGQEFAFIAAFDGATLSFETGGATYRLTPAQTAAAAQADPAGAPPPAPPGGNHVLAEGAFGRLTLDNAFAFIEAVEFALEQVGYPYRFTAAERDELLASFTAAYPLATQADQAVLAQAREIWTNAQANWPRASEEDRRQFVLGVFALFFGEEAVAQWAAAGTARPQGGGAARSCGSFEECTSAFVDERTWTETFHSQGCWAAAGCSDYSPEVGFTFESYD